jgi:membrane peptidoglycan carboxypeptidase
MSDVARTARESGVSDGLHELPSLALGTAELSLLQLTAAYSPLATLGERVRPRLIQLVEDTTGKEIWAPKVERRRVMDAGVAYLVTDLLRDAVDRGTGRGVRQAGFDGPAAGKTGTTDDGQDVWFVGYTPELLAGIWIGFDRPRAVVADATGGDLAAPVWGELMRAVHAGRPAPEPWERPRSVVERSVDPPTGLILADGCRPESGEPSDELFLRSELPSTICPAGEEEGRGILARMAEGIRSFFGRAGELVAGLFRGEDEEAELQRQREEEDRYLGRPRLPRARDRAPDPGEPLGVPLDSLPGWDEVPGEPEPEQEEAEEPEESDEVEIEIEIPDEEPPEPAPGDTIIILRPTPPDG